jgi:uncharacterized protein YjbI with pentapeptide repeats
MRSCEQVNYVCPLWKADLRAMHLQRMDLQKMDLQKMDLQKMDLQKMDPGVLTTDHADATLIFGNCGPGFNSR